MTAPLPQEVLLSRLYIAVRADLPPGLQLAQSVHAAFAYAEDCPDLVHRWITDSNYLVIVSVPDEDALLDLISAAARKGIGHVAVREPDINDEVTACVFTPGEAARRFCSSLPLALRDTSISDRVTSGGSG